MRDRKSRRWFRHCDPAEPPPDGETVYVDGELPAVVRVGPEWILQTSLELEPETDG